MTKIYLLKNYFFRVAAVTFFTFLTVPADSDQQQDHRLKAVPFTNVPIVDDFWAPRIKTNTRVTIPYAFKRCDQTGRINNFAKAAGLMKGEFQGLCFNDSDLYKTIEAAAYSLKSGADAELEEYVDAIIEKIAAAQWEDGYLYTFYSVPRKQPEKRWTRISGEHELYCAGHFFEAAAAYYQATGKRKILDVAIRFADYIDSVFGQDKRHAAPGHEEIEIGLVKLYHVTGDEKYLKLAKFFLDERGRTCGRKIYGKYSQDHKPVTEQNQAVGHAVRACYLYSAMADVAALTGNKDYFNALDRIWENVVSKKLYIIGGIGTRRGGGFSESFGGNYELPNKTAYCETCAAIAYAMWNHRMFLLRQDAKYLDVLERSLYNNFLAGISISGDRFFYSNHMVSRGDHQRTPWFECACCPPNIARFMQSIPGYAYAYNDDCIYVNLFIAGSATIRMHNNTVRLKQQTHYPWDGNVKITVEPEDSEEFAIYVRIPGWAQNRPVPSDLYRYAKSNEQKVTLKVNDKPFEFNVEKGFVRIKHKWEKADVIELNLPMPIRRVLCHEKVQSNRGRIALERGPLVYCAEGIDNDGQVLNFILSDDVPLKAEHRNDILNGVTVISGKASRLHQDKNGKKTVSANQNFTAIPYHAWDNRGKNQMTVWLAQSIDAIYYDQLQ